MKVISFGYNNLLDKPSNCVVIDATGLPYPRSMKSGLEEETHQEVMASSAAEALVQQAVSALQESKDVAFGCMSGFQRSVALAKETADRVKALGLVIEVEHRGLEAP